MKNKIYQTTTDKGYVITEYDDNSWACSCPAWKFHRGERVNCKHINEIIYERKEMTIVIQEVSNSQDSNRQGLETIPQRKSESFSCVKKR